MSKDPFEKLFADFRKDIDKYTKNTPKIFEYVAKLGAVKFVKVAKKITKDEKLVDTGYYRRNWYADATGEIVYCENSVDYASHLEWGTKKNGKERIKGRFVGHQAIEKAQYYCLEELQKALDSLTK